MNRVVFHDEAEAELLAAARFYDGEKPGLGVEFLLEIQRAARAIIAYPELGHRFSKRVRRVLVRRFPYGVLYRLEDERVFVVAIAHVRRRPSYWRHRDLPNPRLQRTAPPRRR